MPRPTIRFTFTPTSHVARADRGALWDIYSQSFDAELARFDAALDRAGEVLRFHDGSTDELVGMTLVSAFDEEHEGRPFRVVTTSAVCIDRRYRGLSAIQTSGLWWLARERLRAPRAEMFWFFDTFSFASYRLLPNNLEVYWPRPDRAIPSWEAGVIDKLCARQAGDAWDPGRGIIRAQGRRLRPGAVDAVVPSAGADARFFLERNPLYAEGERLPCLAPLTFENARSIIRSSWRRMRRRRSREAVAA